VRCPATLRRETRALRRADAAPAAAARADEAGPALAPLRAVSSRDELQGGPFVALLLAADAPQLLLQAAGDAALASRLAGAIVLDAAEAAERPASDSPASRTPQREWAESSAAAAHVWNPRGTGLASLRLPFPVLLAAPGDGAAALRAAAAHNARAGFGSPRLYHARLDHAMTAHGDSAACLQAATCLPLGGYSAFAALPAAPPSSAPPPRLLLVTAALDAAAFFHERAVGVDAALSGLLVLLAAADALGRLPALPAPPARRVAFAALAGEPWGALGSRMLAAQLAGGARPAGVSAAEAAAADVLELGALGCDVAPGAPVQLYTHAAGDAGAPLGAALAAAAAASGAGLRVAPASAPAQGLPPSGLRALRRRHAAWGGVVLSDYDAAYGNANAGSRFDDELPTAAAIAAAADVVAAAVHALAAGGAARPPQPPAGGRAATLRRVEALMVRNQDKPRLRALRIRLTRFLRAADCRCAGVPAARAAQRRGGGRATSVRPGAGVCPRQRRRRAHTRRKGAQRGGGACGGGAVVLRGRAPARVVRPRARRQGALCEGGLYFFGTMVGIVSSAAATRAKSSAAPDIAVLAPAQGGVVRLVRALLANATAAPPCVDAAPCGGGACVRGRCVPPPGAAPTAAFVPAWSPALSYDAEADAWRVNATAPDAEVDPFWTERRGLAQLRSRGIVSRACRAAIGRTTWRPRCCCAT